MVKDVLLSRSAYSNAYAQVFMLRTGGGLFLIGCCYCIVGSRNEECKALPNKLLPPDTRIIYVEINS